MKMLILATTITAILAITTFTVLLQNLTAERINDLTEEIWVQEPCSIEETHGLKFLVQANPRAVCLLDSEINPAGCTHLTCAHNYHQ